MNIQIRQTRQTIDSPCRHPHNRRALLGAALAIAAAVVGAAPQQAQAQTGTVTPYSRFGYGMLSEQANAAQRAMGGVGYAMRTGREVNFMNPASYTAVDSLTILFDIACNIKSVHSSEGAAKGSNFTGGLEYFNIQAPLARWCAATVGMMPYSEVGYSFGDKIVNGHNAREGSGAINQLFLGYAARPFKGFSVGFNVAYLFGTLTNDTYVYTSNASTSLFERTFEVRDYNFTFGAQYAFAAGKHHEFAVGAVFSPGKSWRGHTYGIKYDVGVQTVPDTIGRASLHGKYDMAATYGVGVAWTWRKRLNVEADFTFQPWKDAKYAPLEGFDDAAQTRFNDRWRAAVGGSYIPELRGSYLKRINYRVGGYYGRDYIRIGDNSLREWGLSAGFGLPTPGSKSMISLTFDYKHRQAHPNPLVKENYFVVTLGINFNEFAFFRNKLR